MVLGFTGWMDGGRVSTGTIEILADATGCRKSAEIDSAEFYVHNFPVGTLPISIVTDGDKPVVQSLNPMEQAAVFRPHTKITDGVVRELTFPRNDLLCSESAWLVLFTGEEPHIRWHTYADCLIEVVAEYGVREIFFIGSVASPIPHTRAPRVRSGISSDDLRQTRQRPDVGLSEYEGAASFVTYLLTLAAQKGIEMRTLVVEIPHYPFLQIPTYPASVVKAMSVLGDWLALDFPLSDLKQAQGAVAEQLDDIMEENGEFKDLVRRLEDAYDAEEAEEEAVDEELLKRLIDDIGRGGGV